MYVFLNDFGSKSACGGGKASGKGKPSQNPKEIKQIVNFSFFFAKKRFYRDLGAMYGF